MPNYDMSQPACLERAEQIKQLENTVSKKDFSGLLTAVTALHKMVNINHAMINKQQKMINLLKEEITCLKQDS